MEIVEVSDYDAMSVEAANLVMRHVVQNPSLVLGLATGATPIGTYKYIVDHYKKNRISFKNVHTVNLDEYIGLETTHQNSYATYMKENLFNHLDIPIEQTHIPNGKTSNLIEECERYEELIQSLGGIDLQLLGIGLNGHIGFNEPGVSFDSKTNVIKLAQSTQSANSQYFKDDTKVPTHAITMGISTIMTSKRIVLLVSGKEKADILYKIIYGELNKNVPASILKKHPNVRIIADLEALSVLKEKRSVNS
ncbi:glucosamine-6-phosphate deaminase [Bacillus solitudinis]|uniref:glucosamine-6-phosphate deaminase n=1 Tax=Bacillus solitudinis TaxID=2014074 RepID=UPI000C239D73|nr:glucosamine-6-phosphate deaminase [Bacillus solitudinis]